MKKYKWVIILVNFVLVIGVFNYSMFKKESLLSDGNLILLELAPVDPRSLMQGDYMRLRYDISSGRNYDSLPKKGYCVVALDSNGVGKKVRFQAGTTPINSGEYLVKYRNKGWRLNIGAESYFFQEGEAEKYDSARYGGIKTDKNGNSLLVGLYDVNRKIIK